MYIYINKANKFQITIHIKTRTLFKIIRKWKQSKCPPTDECINNYSLSIQWGIIQLLDTCCNMGEPRRFYRGKKLVTKDYILYYSVYIRCSDTA